MMSQRIVSAGPISDDMFYVVRKPGILLIYSLDSSHEVTLIKSYTDIGLSGFIPLHVKYFPEEKSFYITSFDILFVINIGDLV